MKAAQGDDAEESDRLPGVRHPRETTVLFGHASAERALLETLRSRRVPHAWLFGGPEGIGKATLAWRFARFLLAHPDLASDAVRAAEDLAVPEDHPAVARVAAGAVGDVAVLRREVNEKTGRLFTEIRVDDVRRASGLFQRASRAGGYRICILDCADDLNRSSANALLKLIEDPPALSLFLLVAHRPARVLPTVRSRCRMMMLSRLEAPDVLAAVRALGPPSSAASGSDVAAAVARGGGSVRATLSLLAGDSLVLGQSAAALLDRLPDLDWAGLHGLADQIGNEDDRLDAVVAAAQDWLHARVRASAGRGGAEPRRLAALAEVWDKVTRSARDAQAFNLDKRALLFSVFADLAQATRTP